MLELVNQTPWQAVLFPGWGRERSHQLTLVVKLSFTFDLSGELQPLQPGAPLEFADRHHGDPQTTSLAVAADLAPFKQGGEIMIQGTAHPRAGARVMNVEAGLELCDGSSWRKSLRVTGERRWRRRMLGVFFDDPAPLQPLPLRYEYAFGGVDTKHRSLEPRNPVGRGYVKGGKVVDGDLLPQIEQGPKFITRPSQRPQPAGFGPIPSHWEPRYADHRALGRDAESQCPYPDPVPAELFNCAPPDQRLKQPFLGGEGLHLRGFFPDFDETLYLHLPEPGLEAFSLIAQQPKRLALRYDTLCVDTDARELSLIGRATLPWTLTDVRAGYLLLRARRLEQAA